MTDDTVSPRISDSARTCAATSTGTFDRQGYARVGPCGFRRRARVYRRHQHGTVIAMLNSEQVQTLQLGD
jgi:hypothetical protein